MLLNIRSNPKTIEFNKPLYHNISISILLIIFERDEWEGERVKANKKKIFLWMGREIVFCTVLCID